MQSFVNGFALTLILLVPYLEDYISFKTGWLLSIISIGYFCFQKIQNGGKRGTHFFSQFSGTTILAIVIFGLLSIHNINSRYSVFGLRQALTDTIPDMLLFSAVVVMMCQTGNTLDPRKWMELNIGLGCYCAVNLAAYLLGVRASNETELEVGTFAIGTSIEKRMLAPFSSGVNSFGTICLLALGCSVLYLFSSRSKTKHVDRVICVAIVGISSVCVYLVQIRSSLFVMLLLGLYLWISSRRLRADQKPGIRGEWIYTVTAITVFLLPILYFNLIFAELIEEILPDSVFSLGRSSVDFSHFGGRAFVWDDAWEQLSQGRIGIFGQGIEFRDSSSVLNLSIGSDYGVRTSYHNGSAEMLVVYGGFGYALLALSQISIALHFKKINLVGDLDDKYWSRRIAFGAIILCVSLTILEAFTTSAIFWSIVAVATMSPSVVLGTSTEGANRR